MIIAIDGTAASGKGSLAKNLSKSLFVFNIFVDFFLFGSLMLTKFMTSLIILNFH